ncbi:hypothetical protein BN946_scf184868.g1 [Trametes cinnabarina]|uniref:Amine oxidase domain-containing protein n=1 Tax=Pycnoporus cinnabarinus TaxID=5643 RepID=A0A060SPV9_PYCCI|nr:hypothetical protein BN946_scf184868.g1 [Trametes cinnabarina]
MLLHLTLIIPLCVLAKSLGSWAYPVTSDSQAILDSGRKDARVLILGGGVAGVIAARTLHEQGIDDFIIVEARPELGGRMISHRLGDQWTVEVGANWVQGTQTGDGPANPIWNLAKKHNISLRSSDYFGNVATYDHSGPNDFQRTFQESIRNFDRLTATAGARVPQRLVAMTARSGYSLSGTRPNTPHEMASEYYQFDWEFGATPEETSWRSASASSHLERYPHATWGCACGDGSFWWRLASSDGGAELIVLQAHNNTFRTFSRQNLLSIDQRGFKTAIQEEAEAFLVDQQLRLNATVATVRTSNEGVSVVLTDGVKISADYALCTFSLGVLQHDDVQFIPPLPTWKQEAIHSMAMMALYADHERGRYPVWQSLDHESFYPGCGILFVTVTGDYSRRIESMTDGAVQAEIIAVLQVMFPSAAIPDPLDFYFQRWYSDPLFRGSYSNWPANFLSEHQANLRANVDERLWFAGEATSKKHFGEWTVCVV